MDRFALKIALLNAFAYFYPVCMATYVDSKIDHVIYGYRDYWMGYWVALGFIFPLVFTYLSNSKCIETICSKIDYSARWKALLTFLSLYFPIIVALAVNFGPEYPHLAISTNSLGYGLLVALLVYVENYKINPNETKEKLREDHITWLVFSAFSLVGVILFFLILYDAFPELSQQYTNSLEDQVRLFNSFVIDLFIAIIFAVFSFIRLFQKVQQFKKLSSPLNSQDSLRLPNLRAYDIKDLTWDSIGRFIIISSIIIGTLWFLYQRNFEPLFALLGVIYLYINYITKKNNPEGLNVLQMATSHQFGNSYKVINLPYVRNSTFFTGRGILLDKLHTNLDPNIDIKVLRTQVLVGLDGVGKTQIALEYAYHYIEDYSTVWWIRSEKAKDLAADYAELASRLGLHEKDYRKEKLKIDAVKRWLENNTRWLLVFDSAQEPSELKSYLPKKGSGSVIITSRNPNWGLVEDLEVKGFEREESIEFLIKRTNDDNRVMANDLAEALGDLPLALELAGAFIKERGISLKEYMDRFRSRSFIDNNSTLLEHGDKMIAYNKVIAATCSIFIKEIVRDVPVSLDLLNLFSFLDPDNIPLSLLFRGAKDLPEPLGTSIMDELELHSAIEILKKYSLISTNEGGFSMHRLMQAFIRNGLSDADYNKWEAAANHLMEITYIAERSLPQMNISSPRQAGDPQKETIL